MEDKEFYSYIGICHMHVGCKDVELSRLGFDVSLKLRAYVNLQANFKSFAESRGICLNPRDSGQILRTDGSTLHLLICR